MNNHISAQIIEFCELYADLIERHTKEKDFKLTAEEISKANKLTKDIINFMFWNPGALIEFEREKDLILAKDILSLIWDVAIDSGEVFYELTEGESWIDANDLVSSISQRLKLIKPTLLLSQRLDYNPNFKIYYKEAMTAYLYGLKNAAIILCCALIEEALEDKLSKFSLDYKNETLFNLIEHSKFLKVIDDELYQKLKDIKDIRNKSVHELADFSDKSALEQIINTKEIIERLYQS